MGVVLPLAAGVVAYDMLTQAAHKEEAAPAVFMIDRNEIDPTYAPTAMPSWMPTPIPTDAVQADKSEDGQSGSGATTTTDEGTRDQAVLGELQFIDPPTTSPTEAPTTSPTLGPTASPASPTGSPTDVDPLVLIFGSTTDND